MREHVRIEQHPAEQHHGEADDEAPGPADRRDLVGQPVADTGARIGLIGGIAADQSAAFDTVENAPFLGIERMRGLAQQPQGEVGERDLGHAGHPRAGIAERNRPVPARSPRGNRAQTACPMPPGSAKRQPQ
ncbi:hypothetical protein WR25_16613 [Diploscapter pachys]|uniref:Uncharacterized protein n=1 Tax=Diploscapter pachys TaxID=2018661 RepID=A0A2A2M5B7_9BILA|nr:hypothetical protein WR25_16613 [Diploscapter pachys]